MNDERRHRLHVGIAESGKLLALAGRHGEALARYREALRLAHAARAPQLFARHYLHCVLESLEHMGAHAEAATLAGEAAAATPGTDAEPSPFHRRDRANLLERQGINTLRKGDVAEARRILAAALALDPNLPLARQVLDWTARGLTVGTSQLAAAQRRHGYFVVRKDTVDTARAIDPDALGSPARTEPQETVHG